jgi:hypothetical protein
MELSAARLRRSGRRFPMRRRAQEPASSGPRASKGLLGRFRRGDEKRVRRRRKELDERFQALREAARHPELFSDARAFLELALGRLAALLAGLPSEVRGQELTLSWLEGLLVPLERQVAGLPPEVAPFATRLPTTVAEEKRRSQAMGLLEALGARMRREREEILASLDEVEAGLG